MSLRSDLQRAIRSYPGPVNHVAKGSGVAFAVVSRFLHNKRDITLDTANRIADFLELSLQPTGKGQKGT